MLSACISVLILWEIRITVLPAVRFFSASRIFASVSASTADRESSKIMISGCRISICAIAVRCFCPPESVTPRSPTYVSYPFVKCSIVSSRLAVRAARRTSSSTTRFCVMAMFSDRVLENR